MGEGLEMAGSERVAIVTGASAGIGLAITERLVARGVRVVMVARTRATLEKEAARIGARAIPWPLDVGDLEAVAALPDAVVARLGRLDVLVNNAGLHHRGPVGDRAPAELAEMVHVNLSAPIALCRAALPHLPAGGAIVNVASLAGRAPVPGSATYGASKAGLRYFTASLAYERPDLRVSVVSPGPVDTGFFGDVSQVTNLTFSQPMVSAEVVAEAVERCLERPSGEIAIPWISGFFTRLVDNFRGLGDALRPLLERRGAAAKARYIARKSGALPPPPNT